MNLQPTYLPGTTIKVTRASDMEQDYLTSGSKVLDEFLYGGIPTFGLTEIVGESGTGKTQFCLQLALLAQLPKSENGLNSEAIYISTEQCFPSKRLVELSQHFIAKYKQHLKCDPMDKVLIEHISNSEALMNCLQVRIKNLNEESKLTKKSSPPRLIIIDSIAALFRADYSKEEIKRRTQDLREIGTILHDIGRIYNAAIVVVNQVTGNFSETREHGSSNIPSLGLAWKNFITTRILLSRERDDNNSLLGGGESDDPFACSRTLSIKFAPHVPNGSIPIKLNQEGIKAALPSFLRLDDDT